MFLNIRETASRRSERTVKPYLYLCGFCGLALDELLGGLAELAFAVGYSLDLLLVRLSEQMDAAIIFAAQTKTCFLGTSDPQDVFSGVDAISDATVVVNAVVNVHGGSPFCKRVIDHPVMYKLINCLCLCSSYAIWHRCLK